MEKESLSELIKCISKNARKASHELSILDTKLKNKFLNDLADSLLENSKVILSENAKDIEAAKSQGLTPPMIERLKFNLSRIENMAEGVRQVSKLDDPVGQEVEKLNPPRGFDLRKVRVPIGVIGIIYESRPNVTIDCAILCLKSGNACILRGGKEAFHSNSCLIEIVQECLKKNNINKDAVQLIPTTDRTALNVLLKQDKYIHCIIPRGGENLIRFTVENSRIPVIKHYTGVCSIFIDKDYTYKTAESITINSKCQRPSVCNAVENLLIHQDSVDILPKLARALNKKGVELRIDEKSKSVLKDCGIPLFDAQENELEIEYNDLILAISVVPDIESAISLINEKGSAHTDCIVTNNKDSAKLFLRSVDSSTVLHNASTRFSDGFEFGLGAEIGISTDRLHARGPMGLNELCTYKYLIHGKSEIKD